MTRGGRVAGGSPRDYGWCSTPAGPCVTAASQGRALGGQRRARKRNWHHVAPTDAKGRAPDDLDLRADASQDIISMFKRAAIIYYS
jgi:hypothetical protein